MKRNTTHDSGVLITDADNTLWDTNKVFAGAQLNLLNAIEQLAGVRSSSSDRLAFVRRLDQAVAQQDHRGLKYPPIVLVHSLWQEIAGRRRGGIDEQTALSLAQAFQSEISHIPQLRKGVLKCLNILHEHKTSVWVVSEGRRKQILNTLAEHGLSKLCSRVITAEKTTGLYMRLRKLAPHDEKVVCVGDQLDKDIEIAYRAGIETAYFPGDFRPSWTDDSLLKFANHVITDFCDLLPIFELFEVVSARH
jgi:putative hydrolase of the HAD superfamily